MENLTLDTWIISDTHFGHKNIIKYCNRPMNHDQIMLDRWRETVQPEDTVLHLGDLVVWYNIDKSWLDILRELPGDKHLVMGNHDRMKVSEYEDLGFTVHEPFKIKFGTRWITFSHYPVLIEKGLSVHGHIHNNKLKNDTNNTHNNPRFRNVSVEVIDYRPVRLRDVIAGGYKCDWKLSS